MSIERKCENCFFKDFLGDKGSWTCTHCKFNGIDNDYDVNCKYDNFEPTEEASRQDERNKIITVLKSDLENTDLLTNVLRDLKDIHELLENNAVRKHIEETIELLEKEV